MTFDRHVNNCAVVVGLGADRTFLPDEGPLADRVSYAVLGDNSTSSVDINTAIFHSGGTPGREVLADSDFHLIGLCSSTQGAISAHGRARRMVRVLRREVPDELASGTMGATGTKASDQTPVDVRGES